MRKTRKRFLCLIIAVVILLSVGQGISLPKASAASNDWEIAREEWFLRICGNETNDASDVRIRRLLDMLDYRAQNYLRMMDTSSSAKRLFHSSSTDNVPITATGDMTKEYDYLRQIALAYGTYGSKYYKNSDVQAKLLYGLKWLNEHYYGQKQTYGKGADGWHLMTGFNWWDWYIGTSQLLFDIMIVLDHFDLLTTSMINTYLAPVKYVIDDPDGMYRYYVDNDETYDHKVKHIVVMLGYSLLKEDSSMMAHLVDDVAFCMQVSPDGNGIREDGSFRFHEYHAMEATYGADVLVNRIIKTTGILHATSFLDSIGQTALAGQVDWFTEIFAPVMHNGVVMAQSGGRMPQNGISNGNIVLRGALALVGLYPQKDATLRQFIREQMGDNNLSSFDMIYYQSVLNDVQDEAQGGNTEEYARTRYTTDRVVQHRQNYTAGLALSSNRTIRYECINNCNTDGWYTGDGMLYVYTDKTTQKFDEYGAEYFTNVNMYRLPGTTEDTATRKKCSISSTYRHHLIPNESFVGGVQFDDDYATIAYDFAAYNSTGNENVVDTGYGGGNPAVTSDLKAKKSYFFFDNEIVCLGAGITSTNPSNIRTYVDNRQLSKSAMVNGTLVYGSEDITVNGTRMEKSDAYTKSFTDPKSVYVEDFGGYYFPNGGSLTLNKTGGSAPFYELWLEHGEKPSGKTYSYVMLPTIGEAAVAAYAKKPEIEIVVNNESYQIVRDVSSGITGYVFWKAGSCNGITVDKPLTVMLREQDGMMKISVADPTQALTTATVTIAQRLYLSSADKEITVTESDQSTKLVIDFASVGGRSVTAELGQKSTREMLFSFTGTTAEKQSYATATYGGNDFGNANSWQSNGNPIRPTMSTANGGTMTVNLTEGKTYHWLQITEQNLSHFTNPLQYIPHKDDVVQLRFKLENCTVGSSAQVSFLYVGAEETVDSITVGQSVKQALPSNYQLGDYVVVTFRNLPASYSALKALASFRIHFDDITAGAGAKLTFDTIYIGNEANAPASAPLYFDFGGSATELYRYTDACYGSGAYNFANGKYWSYHTGRTAAFDLSNGILSFTVVSDETMGSSTWVRPSNGAGSNTALLLNFNRKNIEVAQLRLRITGTLRSNSEISLALSQGGGKFVSLAVAQRALLKTGEFYILNLPLQGSASDAVYGLFTLDTRNMQGCKLEIDYIYIGNQANAPRTEGLHMDFTNSMSDVYRYNLPQYLSYYYDDSYHWAINGSLSTRPVVNAQNGCLEYLLKSSQSWLRPSIGRNDSQTESLSYNPSANDVVQIHFRADGFTGSSGSLQVSFTDGTKQSNGWFVFQALADAVSFKPKDGQFITLTLPLTSSAKASTIRGITLDFRNMAGCKMYIDSVYIGPANAVPCCSGTHKSVSSNAKAATCTANGYSGDSYCELCGYQTAKGLILDRKAHTYSYTRLDYSHKALCSVCKKELWEPHWYGSKGLCACGAKEADAPADYLFMGFENDAEAQGRYNQFPYCGYNYDTSTCWGYNTTLSTAPTVNAQEETLSFKALNTSVWIRPSLSKRSVGCTNLYFPVSKIEVFQIRLKLLRETANPSESIHLSYTAGTYNSSNGNPVYSNIKSFSTAEVNAIPNGEYVTLTVPLSGFKFTWDTLRGFNLSFNGMQGTTVAIDYIYFGSWANIASCKAGHSYTSKVTTAATCTADGVKTYTCSACKQTKTEAIAAMGHTEVIDKAVAPTCTTAGKTEGKHCAVCNAVIVKQAEIAAIGHDYDYSNGTVTTEPTLHSTGVISYTCRNDNNHKETKELQALHETLLFQFSNTDADKARYNNYTYGFVNFDEESPMHWVASGLSGTNCVANADNIWRFTSKGTYNGTSGTTYAIETSLTASAKSTPLNYDPENAQCFQIRYKTDGFDSCSRFVYIEFYSDSTKYLSSARAYSYATDGDYVVYTAEIPETVRALDKVVKIRAFFGCLSGYSPSSSMSVDYIYVGTWEELPTSVHLVTFENEGSILQSEYVANGASVVYRGKEPVKSYDDNKHYSFKGWDKALTNITADTTITATFTATAHSYSYSMLDGTNHKASCACGYTKTVSHSWNSGEIQTQPTCTETGEKLRTCIDCKATKTEPVAALGHTPVYTDNGNKTHTVSCENCDYSEIVNCTFENGECICGAKEVLAPIYDEAVKFSHSLTLENDISINFIGLGSALSVYDSFYLECKVPVYNGNELVGYETVNIEPVYNGKNYECTLLGVTAKMMNDNIEAVFRMTKDGQEYYSKTDVYSVAEYAYGKLDSIKATDTAELKAICANLLRYGSMAQTQFNYRTDALVDADMTDAHKAYLTDLSKVEMKDYRKQINDLTTVIVPWKSTTLELGNKVIMCLIANLANYAGDPSELTMRLSYTDAKGVTVTEERPIALYNPEALTYAVSYDGLRATEMRTIVSAAIYRNGERVTKTVEYSIESYGARSTDPAMQGLCRAMLAYGDSANAFFSN